MKNVLFICSQNALRSPTAERLYMVPALIELLEARVPRHLGLPSA